MSEALNSFEPTIPAEQHEEILMLSCLLDIFLAGREEGCFSNQRRLYLDKPLLGALFRDYLKSKLPRGFRIIKESRVYTYEIRDPYSRRQHFEDLRNIESEAGAIRRRHEASSIADCDINTIGLWLLEEELLAKVEVMRQAMNNELPGVSRINHRGFFSINMDELLLSSRGVAQPVLAINAIGQECTATFETYQTYERYQRLKALYDSLDFQRRQGQLRQGEQQEADGNPPAEEQELTLAERAALALQRAAELAHRQQERIGA